MNLFKIKDEKLQELEDKLISERIRMHLNNYKNHSEAKIKEYQEFDNMLKEVRKISAKWGTETKDMICRMYNLSEDVKSKELKFLYKNSIKDCIKFLTLGELNIENSQEILNYRDIVNYSFEEVMECHLRILRNESIDYLELDKLNEEIQFFIDVMKLRKDVSLYKIDLLEKFLNDREELYAEEINYIYVEGLKDCLKSLM